MPLRPAQTSASQAGHKAPQPETEARVSNEAAATAALVGGGDDRPILTVDFGTLDRVESDRASVVRQQPRNPR
jgi:hypothetical protein